MREYETTLIIQPEISDEGVQKLCEQLDGILDKSDGIRLMFDDQGRRRLAYEIENFQKGRYVTLHFLSEGAAIPGLERVLRLDESVLRFLTVQVAEEVSDIEARKAEAAEEVRIRAQRAAERAAREAEEAAERAAREAEEAAGVLAESDEDEDFEEMSEDDVDDSADDEMDEVEDDGGADDFDDADTPRDREV